MGKFKLEDYDPVEKRIKDFYTEHPDGAIVTSLITAPDNMDYVVVRAEIYVAGVLRASGLAQEMRDKELKQGNYGTYESVNYTSWLENAETSAIGRALANFNYAGNKRPSREEMQKVDRMTTDPAMEKRQQNHFDNMEHKARLKAKDLIDSAREIIDDEVLMALEIKLAGAKGYDEVVKVGKEIRKALEEDEPTTKEEKARAMING